MNAPAEKQTRNTKSAVTEAEAPEAAQDHIEIEAVPTMAERAKIMAMPLLHGMLQLVGIGFVGYFGYKYGYANGKKRGHAAGVKAGIEAERALHQADLEEAALAAAQ